ncbi:MAG TPA: molybdate ABC transporter substrate-binding protein, partial [Acidobacteriaceae bacterium]|nr:molybdate ABC transporter substrate-binding protein [Acidobacteriaceae bacterium]
MISGSSSWAALQRVSRIPVFVLSPMFGCPARTRCGRVGWKNAGCLIEALLAWVCAAAFALTLPASAQAAAPREIHVLAAADLQPVLPALTDRFQHESGIKVVASYASSATLTTQILNGAPADLFLAADFSFPEQIVAAHLADAPEPVPYARGVLVLWARKDSPFQPLTQNTLRDAHFLSLAIANPDHAPYGRAAVAALTWMKLYDQLKPRIVQAENIAQAAQFVQSGNAQLGLISLTSATTPEMQQAGTFIRIPEQTYPEIRQCAVVLLKSPHASDAHHFLDWLRSPAI